MMGVEVEGFSVTELKKGDYGYNMAYGVLDGGIEVGFKIPYQKENDALAPRAIEEELKANVGTVRLIAKSCSPTKAASCGLSTGKS